MTSSWKRTVAITHWLQAGCHDSDVINAKTFVCLITFIFADISVYETNLLRIPHCDAIYFLTQCVDIPTQISWAQLNGLHWTTNTLLKVFRWYFNFTVIALCFVYWNCYKAYLIQIMLTHLPPGQNGRHFGRRQFQRHFLQWKLQDSDSNFTEICSQECNWQ